MAESKPKMKELMKSEYNLEDADVQAWKVPQGCYDDETEGYSLKKICEYLADAENGVKIDAMAGDNAWVWYFLSAGLYKYVNVNFLYVSKAWVPVCYTQNYECNPTSKEKCGVTECADGDLKPALWKYAKPKLNPDTLEPMEPEVGSCNDNETLQKFATAGWKRFDLFDFHGVCDYKVVYVNEDAAGNRFIGASSNGDCIAVLVCENGWLIFNWADSKYKGTRRQGGELKGVMSSIGVFLDSLRGEENGQGFITYKGGDECSFKC